jgi:plastocyanin
VIRSWHIFVFTMIPLALVLGGVVAGSFLGGDTQREVFPTPAARGTPAPAGPGQMLLQVTAQNLRWAPESLSAPADTEITIRMNHRDPGVLHNVAIYRNRNRTGSIYAGDLVVGPIVQDYRFRTPGPGNYFFICDAHPDTMVGTFTVR